MPIANYEQYNKMIDNAQNKGFAYPAVNITSMATVNAVMCAFAEKKSDGIIQVSIGGGKFASGTGVADPVVGAIALADYVRYMADQYDVYFAVHTDHCQPEHIEDFLVPLIEETEKRRRQGLPNLFQSHMYDGSSLPLKENIDKAIPLLQRCAQSEIILEVEAGVVGGEEDGVDNEGVSADKLYTSPEDMLYVHEQLSQVKGGRFLFAAVFGNVHGVYKPGAVKLRPDILQKGQQAVVDKYGKEAYFDLVFHGGSGSSIEEIHETIEYGVVKMNVDTDMQYAFTRPIVDHMLKNYDGVLKVDKEVGSKKVYDPRSYIKKAEVSMYEKTKEVIDVLKSANQSLYK